jgi:hypothetical protein
VVEGTWGVPQLSGIIAATIFIGASVALFARWMVP